MQTVVTQSNSGILYQIMCVYQNKGLENYDVRTERAKPQAISLFRFAPVLFRRIIDFPAQTKSSSQLPISDSQCSFECNKARNVLLT